MSPTEVQEHSISSATANAIYRKYFIKSPDKATKGFTPLCVDESFCVVLVGKKGLVFLLLQGDYLLAAVETASLANTMCQYHFIAFGIGALYHTGHSELGVVGSSLVSACLGYLSLRYCHNYTSSSVYNGLPYT
jgi:hypothetical protein